MPPLGQHGQSRQGLILGTKGTADVFGNSITGAEQVALYRGRRQKNTTCTRPSMTRCSPRSATVSPSTTPNRPPGSTLLAMMGRMAAYTGEVITPEQILESKEDLSPAKYEFGPDALPVAPIPVPRLHQADLI